jgi:hypothetical protein
MVNPPPASGQASLWDRFYPLLIIPALFYFASCSGGSSSKESEEETKTEVSYEEAHGAIILNMAREEQQKEMYAKSSDSTSLYWLNNKYIKLKNRTKCNIYALNVLYKSGFRTPKTNALTRDLVDTSQFQDILPVVGISDPEIAKKGDLIAWNGHVIIFDYLEEIRNDIYAHAWWAGTSQRDNGDNILNNVVYGKYKLNGYYVIRRPLKK